MFAEAERWGVAGAGADGDGGVGGERGQQVMYDDGGGEDEDEESTFDGYEVYDEGAGYYGQPPPGSGQSGALEEEPTAFMGSVQEDEYAD